MFFSTSGISAGKGRGKAFRRVRKNLDEAFEQNEVEDK